MQYNFIIIIYCAIPDLFKNKTKNIYLILNQLSYYQPNQEKQNHA